MRAEKIIGYIPLGKRYGENKKNSSRFCPHDAIKHFFISEENCL